MMWTEPTLQGKLRVVLMEHVSAEPIADREYDDGTYSEWYACPECGEEAFIAVYAESWAKAGCRNDDCPLKPYMTVYEMLEAFWQTETDGILPGEERMRKQALRAKIRQLGNEALEREKADREAQLQSAVRDAQQRDRQIEDLNSRLSGREKRIQGLEHDVERANQDRDVALEERQRSIDKGAFNAAFVSGAVTVVATFFWTGVFTRRVGVQLDAWWMMALVAISLLYGVAMGWVVYLGMVRDDATPYYERADIENLAAWSLKAALVFGGSFLLVGPLAGWEPVYSFAPPGSTESTVLAVFGAVNNHSKM